MTLGRNDQLFSPPFPPNSIDRQSKERLFLITEWCPGGTLYDKIYKNKNFAALSQREALQNALDIAAALEYLHSFRPKFIHRDIKPKNIFFGEGGVLKLGDFGLCRFKSDDGNMTGGTGSSRWMAPEVVRSERYDEKVDIYSLGMCLWEMLACETPLSEFSEIQAAMMSAEGKRPTRPGRASPPVWALIQECWDPAPSRRPSAPVLMRKLMDVAKQIGVELRYT